MSKKITELPAASTVETTDVLAFVDLTGPTTQKVTVAAIGDTNHPGLSPAFLAASPLSALIVNGAGTAITGSLIVDLPLPLADLDPAGAANGDFVSRIAGVWTYSKTLVDPIITGTVTYQGTRMRILSIPGEVQTTDDTVTTVVSFTMVDETMCAFDVIVCAALQTAVTDGGRWKRSVVYRRTGAGVPTIVGTLETGTDQEVSAGLDVTIDDDGVDTVRVRVTGLPATSNMNWTAELRVQETLATP